jgi:hypothetical protein
MHLAIVHLSDLQITEGDNPLLARAPPLSNTPSLVRTCLKGFDRCPRLGTSWQSSRATRWKCLEDFTIRVGIVVAVESSVGHQPQSRADTKRNI